jgi:hypothetical protein
MSAYTSTGNGWPMLALASTHRLHRCPPYSFKTSCSITPGICVGRSEACPYGAYREAEGVSALAPPLRNS